MESSEKASQQFQKDGFLPISNGLTGEGWQVLVSEVEKQFQDGKDVVDFDNLNTVALKHTIEAFPNMMAVLSEEMISVLKAYFRSNFEIYSAAFYKTIPQKNHIGNTSLMWHFDNMPRGHIKAFFYLTDTNTENAPLRLHKKPTSQQLKEQGFYDRNRYPEFKDLLDDPSSFIDVQGKSGTAFLFESTHVIHRATFAQSKHRTVLMLTIVPSIRSWETLLQKNASKLSLRQGYCTNPFTGRSRAWGFREEVPDVDFFKKAA